MNRIRFAAVSALAIFVSVITSGPVQPVDAAPIGVIATTSEDFVCPTMVEHTPQLRSAERREVFAQFGIPADRVHDYMIVRAIKAELGGAPLDMNNLVVIPKSEAHAHLVMVARMNHLRTQVCHDEISLTAAQELVRYGDEFAAYRQLLSMVPRKV